MNAYIGGEPVADLVVQSAPLHGIHIDEEHVPLAIDEFPAILVAAACASGETVLSGAEELESKRVRPYCCDGQRPEQYRD